MIEVTNTGSTPLTNVERENRRTGVRVGARYEEGTLNDYLPAVSAAMDSMEFPSTTASS